MASQSSHSNSWLGRFRNALRRKQRASKTNHTRRGLRFESLESRSMLSATVLPTASGIVYKDLTGNGLTADDAPLSGVSVSLFRDGGDGVFNGKNFGGDDTLFGSTTSDVNGKYQFPNLTAGTYFVQEAGVPGLTIPAGQGVVKLVVTNADTQGIPGVAIDTFNATSQYASGSLHTTKTGTSSLSAPEAIGGHRNLFVKLESPTGSVSLGANSDVPGALDFASSSAANGAFSVNWDGGNSSPGVLDTTGLGQVDLTTQGSATGIKLNISADHDNGNISLRVYSDSNNWSSVTVPLPNTIDGSLNANVFVPFASFSVGGGSGANFAQVGAIQLSVTGANANDGQIGPVVTAGPKVFAANFANLSQADLGVVKSASPSSATAGGQLTYTFTTTNYGVSGATGVVLTDVLPPSVHYVSCTSSQGSVFLNNGTFTAQYGSLANGATATTTMIVTVDAGTSGSITNTATVAGNETDPNQSNNTSTVVTPITKMIDLAITKTATPEPAKAGGQLTYTLNVVNNGPANGTGVTLTDALPASVHFVSCTTSQGNVFLNNGTFSAQFGSLAVGATATTTILVTIDAAAAGTITNTASVAGNETETTLANNTASVNTTVPAKIINATPDLRIVKTASPNPVAYGANLTYTLVVSNNSITPATGVTVVDTLPAGLNLVSVATTVGNVSQSSNSGSTISLGNMAGQATATVTIVVNVTSAAAASLLNTATVNGNETDANPSDNTSTVLTPVTTPSQPTPSKYWYLGR